MTEVYYRVKTSFCNSCTCIYQHFVEIDKENQAYSFEKNLSKRGKWKMNLEDKENTKKTRESFKTT